MDGLREHGFPKKLCACVCVYACACVRVCVRRCSVNSVIIIYVISESLVGKKTRKKDQTMFISRKCYYALHV